MTAAAPASARVGRLRAFGQLGKVRLVDIWLGPTLAWSATARGHGPGGGGHSAALCLLAVGTVAFTMYATHAFDDVTGFLDGSDQVNYAPERRRSQVKPLVAGSLPVGEARAFAVGCAVVAVGCVAAFCVLSRFRPWWIFVAAVVAVGLAVQYSAGINFSYRFRGGGEALTGGTLTLTVLLPWAAVTDGLDARAAVEAALFAAWLVQVLICSNSGDAAADRAVGRRTVASTTTTGANRAFVTGFFLGMFALAAGAAAAGALPRWALLTLLPAWALHAHVLRAGRRGVWRGGRNYSFLAVRLGVLGLVVANVLG